MKKVFILTVLVAVIMLNNIVIAADQITPQNDIALIQCCHCSHEGWYELFKNGNIECPICENNMLPAKGQRYSKSWDMDLEHMYGGPKNPCGYAASQSINKRKKWFGI